MRRRQARANHGHYHEFNHFIHSPIRAGWYLDTNRLTEDHGKVIGEYRHQADGCLEERMFSINKEDIDITEVTQPKSMEPLHVGPRYRFNVPVRLTDDNVGMTQVAVYSYGYREEGKYCTDFYSDAEDLEERYGSDKVYLTDLVLDFHAEDNDEEGHYSGYTRELTHLLYEFPIVRKGMYLCKPEYEF